MKKIKSDPNLYFDYRDVKTLSRYIDSYGRIEPVQLAVAIKRARHLALLPFITK